MWVAVILTFLLLIPEVWSVFKTRNTVSISKWMYAIYPICSVAWITYAILLIFEKTPIYEVIGIAVAEGLAMILSIYILIVKLRNVSEARHQHMTEAEWYRAYVKQREAKKRLQNLGIKSDADLNNSHEHQEALCKVLEQLFSEHQDIVDDRVTSSKSFRRTVNRDIKTPMKRLEHFKNVATNAEIANIIYLVYLDMYQGK
ncbi:MAG: hypothetical protein LBV37_02530 [Mycoplasmataceae bacterium]|nr:hypothetical protein [Mycoplasmataceae bacterium]